MKKFAFVMNIPSPYRLHLLGEVWRQLNDRGVGMHVHFMAKGHVDRPKSWLNPKIDFPHTYWRDWGFGQYHFNPGLIWEMVRRPPEWMACGSSFDTFTGFGVQLLGRAKVKLCWLEGNTKTPGKMTGLRGWIKRLVMGRCAFAPVPGSDAAKYVAMHQSHTRMKMPTPVIIPNLVDETRFMPRDKWPADRIAAARKRMGADGNDKLCLIPARLTEVKGLVPFVSLLSPEMLQGWRIVILGQGPLREAILSMAARRKVAERVRILDFVAYEDMPSFYAAADLVLLPSLYDPNPLTVPEALFSGLPIALTDQAGNVEEGVTEGKNGWVLPVKDLGRFAAVLRKVFAATAEELAEKGRWSLARNAEFWRTGKAVRRYLDELGAFGE